MHHICVCAILSSYFYITNTSIKPADRGSEITQYNQKQSCQAKNKTTFFMFFFFFLIYRNVVPTVHRDHLGNTPLSQHIKSLMSVNITMQIRHLLHNIWRFMIVFSLSTILNSPDMNNLRLTLLQHSAKHISQADQIN